MIDMIFDYLKPKEGFFSPYERSGDLFDMLRTCKNMKDIMLHRMFKITVFDLTTILQWKARKNISLVKHLFGNPMFYLTPDEISGLNATSLNLCYNFNKPITCHMLPHNLRILNGTPSAFGGTTLSWRLCRLKRLCRHASACCRRQMVVYNHWDTCY
jgi:hypothetical protein